MANKKHAKQYFKKELGVFDLKRKDILALEDIITKHMTNVGVERAKRLSSNKDPGSFWDYYVTVDGLFGLGIYLSRNSKGWRIFRAPFYEVDGIDDLPKEITRVHYLKLKGFPGIELEFTPRHTRLGAQTNYAVGPELKSMNQCIARLETYLSKRGKRGALFNQISL